MKDVKTMPTTVLCGVLKLLIRLGVYAEEFAVSDTYIYRDMQNQGISGNSIKPEKFKLDGDLTHITTRSNPNDGSIMNRNAATDHWSIGVKDERWPPVLQSNYYKLFRINEAFLDEIIEEIKKGNRKNYTKNKNGTNVLAYNKYRVATLKKLQFVIKQDTIVPMLEEQARKLQEFGLLAV